MIERSHKASRAYVTRSCMRSLQDRKAPWRAAVVTKPVADRRGLFKSLVRKLSQSQPRPQYPWLLPVACLKFWTKSCPALSGNLSRPSRNCIPDMGIWKHSRLLKNFSQSIYLLKNPKFPLFNSSNSHHFHFNCTLPTLYNHHLIPNP